MIMFKLKMMIMIMMMVMIMMMMMVMMIMIEMRTMMMIGPRYNKEDREYVCMRETHSGRGVRERAVEKWHHRGMK